jgi:hypothetical protein
MKTSTESPRSLFASLPRTHLVKDIAIVAFLATLICSFVVSANDAPKAGGEQRSEQMQVAVA